MWWKLYLDFETRSHLDLEVVGLDNYARHPSTEVLMLAYAIDDGPVEIWEPRLGPMPKKLSDDLRNPFYTKVAWYAAFERAIFKHVLKIDTPLEHWRDPSISAKMLSMPGKLEKVCGIMGLPPELAKDPEGERLIDFFCKPGGFGGDVTLFGVTKTWFWDWSTNPKEWEAFKKYCIRDVIAEREIDKKMAIFPLPESEQKGWILDQQINERGLPVDMALVNGALEISAWEKASLSLELKSLTGLENPNSVPQLLKWAKERGYDFNALAKPLVNRALNGECSLTPACRKAFLLRRQASKTSDSKYDKIRDNVGSDGRLHYQYGYLGAAKTGRWNSYTVQLANLPRPTKEVEKNLDLAIELLKKGDKLGLVLSFPNVMEVVTSCIRSAFRATEGSRLIVADLNAIENRMIGWLAGADSILNVFREGRDPYLDFACLIYEMDYNELAEAYEDGDPKAKEIRTQAKPAVLGCGYRLSGGEEIRNEDGDLIKTGLMGYANSMGIKITKEAAHKAVKVFRERYPEVVALWYALEDAAKMALLSGSPQQVGHVTFEAFGNKLLRIVLPSSRALHYIRPKLEMVAFKDSEKETLTYEGVESETKKWVRLKTHGGKLLENISQAISRDILLNGMMNADKLGFSLVGHVHDEIISEVPYASPLGLPDLVAAMVAPPDWAFDLPLGANGFESVYYKKE
jgi:DNA polymerase bacteriophage-type